MAGEGDGRAGPEVEARGSKLLGGWRSAAAVAASSSRSSSTVVFFVGLGAVITHSPGWPEVKATFFNWGEFKASFPEIARAFKLNVKIF